jgi:hypothetical protein
MILSSVTIPIFTVTSTTAKKLDEIFVYDDSGSMIGGDFVNDVLTIGGQ